MKTASQEDVSICGVTSDAIPIMPPYLDGPLGLIGPWGAESSEEEEQWATGGCEDEEDDAVEDEGGDDDPPRQVWSFSTVIFSLLRVSVC